MIFQYNRGQKTTSTFAICTPCGSGLLAAKSMHAVCYLNIIVVRRPLLHLLSALPVGAALWPRKACMQYAISFQSWSEDHSYAWNFYIPWERPSGREIHDCSMPSLFNRGQRTTPMFGIYTYRGSGLLTANCTRLLRSFSLFTL